MPIAIHDGLSGRGNGNAPVQQQSTNLFVGPLSGIIEVSVSHPLDRIKTKMQEMSLCDRKPCVKVAMKEIHRAAGWPGFYTGYAARITGIMPMRLVYWETMRRMNKSVAGKPTWYQLLMPGLTVGLAQTLIDNPIEVLKVRRMTGESKTDWRNVTKGFAPCVLRNIIFSITVSASVKLFGEEHPFLAAAGGGLAGSVISQPLDVVKTEMQRMYGNQASEGMLAIFRRLVHHNPQELFAGTVMRSTLSFVNMGIGFMAFKHIYNFVSEY